MPNFKLSIQTQIESPRNLGAFISEIKRSIGNIDASVNVKINPSTNRQLSQVQTGLGRTRKGADDLTSSLDELGKQSASVARRIGIFTLAAGTLFSTLSQIRTAINDAIEFESIFTKIVQVSGNTSKQLLGLRTDIDRLSTSLALSANEIASVGQILTQTGLEAEKVRIVLQAVAKTRLSPTFGKVEDTVEGVIAAMRQFRLEANQVEGVLDVMNTVAAQFAVESDDLVKAVQRTGSVFRSATGEYKSGTQALNEFFALFTSVRATSRESAETIATGFRTIFARIQRPKTLDLLQELGIQLRLTEEEARKFGNVNLTGTFVGPYEAVKRLSQALKGLPTTDIRFAEITEALGGFRQISKVIPLIQQFTDAEKALIAAQTAQGSVSKDFAAVQKTLAFQISQTRAEFEKLFRVISRDEGFRSLITTVLKLIQSLTRAAEVITPLVAPLLTIGTIAVAKNAAPFLKSVQKNLFLKKAGGGFVPGTGNQDTVPALLTPGEFVIRKKAVQAIGAGNLHALNRHSGGVIPQRFAKGGIVQGFNTGGQVSGQLKKIFDDKIREELAYKISNTSDSELRQYLQNIYQNPKPIKLVGGRNPGGFTSFGDYIAASASNASYNERKIFGRNIDPSDLATFIFEGLVQSDYKRNPGFQKQGGNIITGFEKEGYGSSSDPFIARFTTGVAIQIRKYINEKYTRPEKAQKKLLGKDITDRSSKKVKQASGGGGRLVELNGEEYNLDDLVFNYRKANEDSTLEEAQEELSKILKIDKSLFSAKEAPDVELLPPSIGGEISQFSRYKNIVGALTKLGGRGSLREIHARSGLKNYEGMLQLTLSDAVSDNVIDIVGAGPGGSKIYALGEYANNFKLTPDEELFNYVVEKVESRFPNEINFRNLNNTYSQNKKFNKIPLRGQIPKLVSNKILSPIDELGQYYSRGSNFYLHHFAEGGHVSLEGLRSLLSGAGSRGRFFSSLIGGAEYRDQVLEQIPSGSSYLAAGGEAVVLQQPDGNVIRLAQGANPANKLVAGKGELSHVARQTDTLGQYKYRFRPTNLRPTAREFLQPLSRKLYGNPVELVLEKLPYAPDLNFAGIPEDRRKAIVEHLARRVARRGIVPADVRSANVGVIQKKGRELYRILDPNVGDYNPQLAREFISDLLRSEREKLGLGADSDTEFFAGGGPVDFDSLYRDRPRGYPRQIVSIAKLTDISKFALGGVVKPIDRTSFFAPFQPSSSGVYNAYPNDVIEKLEYSDKLNDVLSFIPSGSQFIGSGVEAVAFRKPDGNVVRIQDILGEDTEGFRPPFSGRPTASAVLQALDSRQVGEFFIEELPYAPSLKKQGVNRNDAESLIRPLKTKLLKEGYYGIDVHYDNVGTLASGENIITDPGFIKYDPEQSKRILERNRYATGGEIRRGPARQYRGGNLPVRNFQDRLFSKMRSSNLNTAINQDDLQVFFNTTAPTDYIKAKLLGDFYPSISGKVTGFREDDTRQITEMRRIQARRDELARRIQNTYKQSPSIQRTDELRRFNLLISDLEQEERDLRNDYDIVSILLDSNKILNVTDPIHSISRLDLDDDPELDLGFGFAKGGQIQRFATGGSVDSVPALLTPGEFVIRKEAAQRIGLPTLNKMNHADKLTSGVARFATGGSVGVQRFAQGGFPSLTGNSAFAIYSILPLLASQFEGFGKTFQELTSIVGAAAAQFGLLRTIGNNLLNFKEQVNEATNAFTASRQAVADYHAQQTTNNKALAESTKRQKTLETVRQNNIKTEQARLNSLNKELSKNIVDRDTLDVKRVVVGLTKDEQDQLDELNATITRQKGQRTKLENRQINQSKVPFLTRNQAAEKKALEEDIKERTDNQAKIAADLAKARKDRRDTLASLRAEKRKARIANLINTGVGGVLTIAQLGGSFARSRSERPDDAAGLTAGALQGASNYGTVGFGVGSLLGPQAALLGAAVGATYGAIKGYNDAVEEGAKQLAASNFARSFEQFSNALGKVSEDLSRAGIQAGNIRQGVKSINERLLVTEGEDKQAVLSDASKSIGGLRQFAAEIAKTSGDLNTFTNAVGEETLRLIARFTDTPLAQLRDEFKKLIEETERSSDAQSRIADSLEREGAIVRNLQEIRSALSAATASAEIFSSSLESTNFLIGGSDIGRIGSPQGLFSNPLSTFDDDLLKQVSNQFGGFFGKRGFTIAEEVQNLAPILRGLTPAFLQFRDQNPLFPEGSEGAPQSFIDLLESQLGGELDTRIANRLVGAIESELIGETGDSAKLFEALRERPFESIEQVASKLQEPFKLFEDVIPTIVGELNSFADGLATSRNIQSELNALQAANIDIEEQRIKFRADFDSAFKRSGDDLSSLQDLDIRRQNETLGENSRLRGNVPGILDAIRTSEGNITRLNSEIKRVRSNPDIDDSGGDIINKFAKLNTELSKEISLRDGLTDHLKQLGDAAARSAVDVERLGRLRTDREAKEGLARSFVFGTNDERREFNRAIFGAIRLGVDGDLSALPDTLRGSTLSLLERFRETELPGFGGKTGQEVIDKVLERELSNPDNRFTKKELEGILFPSSDEERLAKSIESAFDTAKVANDALRTLLGDNQAKFLTELGNKLSLFITDLNKNFAQTEVGRLTSQINTDTLEVNKIKEQLQFAQELRGFGVLSSSFQNLKNSLSLVQERKQALNELSLFGGAFALSLDATKESGKAGFLEGGVSSRQRDVRELDTLFGLNIKRNIETSESLVSRVPLGDSREQQRVANVLNKQVINKLTGQNRATVSDAGIDIILSNLEQRFIAKYGDQLGAKLFQGVDKDFRDVQSKALVKVTREGTTGFDIGDISERLGQSVQTVFSREKELHDARLAKTTNLARDLNIPDLDKILTGDLADKFLKTIEKILPGQAVGDLTFRLATLNGSINQATKDRSEAESNLNKLIKEQTDLRESLVKKQLEGLPSLALLGLPIGVPGLASGGSVPGTGNRDSVAAMLTPGEYVLRKDAVRRIGVDRLEAMNKGVAHFADGGLVPSAFNRRLPGQSSFLRSLSRTEGLRLVEDLGRYSGGLDLASEAALPGRAEFAASLLETAQQIVQNKLKYGVGVPAAELERRARRLLSGVESQAGANTTTSILAQAVKDGVTDKDRLAKLLFASAGLPSAYEGGVQKAIERISLKTLANVPLNDLDKEQLARIRESQTLREQGSTFFQEFERGIGGGVPTGNVEDVRNRLAENAINKTLDPGGLTDAEYFRNRVLAISEKFAKGVEYDDFDKRFLRNLSETERQVASEIYRKRGELVLNAEETFPGDLPGGQAPVARNERTPTPIRRELPESEFLQQLKINVGEILSNSDRDLESLKNFDVRRLFGFSNLTEDQYNRTKRYLQQEIRKLEVQRENIVRLLEGGGGGVTFDPEEADRQAKRAETRLRREKEKSEQLKRAGRLSLDERRSLLGRKEVTPRTDEQRANNLRRLQERNASRSKISLREYNDLLKAQYNTEELTLLQKLQQPFEDEIRDMPLSDVLSLLHSKYGIGQANIINSSGTSFVNPAIDQESLENIGLSSDLPITFSEPNSTVNDLLRSLSYYTDNEGVQHDSGITVGIQDGKLIVTSDDSDNRGKRLLGLKSSGEIISKVRAAEIIGRAQRRTPETGGNLLRAGIFNELADLEVYLDPEGSGFGTVGTPPRPKTRFSADLLARIEAGISEEDLRDRISLYYGTGQNIGQEFASGGIVSGYGNRDSVSALLTPGEFVLRKSAVDQIGVDRLEQLNNPKKYGIGGLVAKAGAKALRGGGESAIAAEGGEYSLRADKSLTAFATAFNQSVLDLTKALSAIPTEFTHRHTVEVIHNGGQIFSTLQPEFEKMVVATVKDFLNKFLQDKFPSLGKV